MLKNISIILVILFLSFPLYAADMPITENSPPQLAEDPNDLLIEEGETVATPVVNGVVYTPEKGSINFSDGTYKNYSAEEMGYKQYEWLFANIKVGEPLPPFPIKKDLYILFTTIVQTHDNSTPPVVVNTKIKGVTLDGEIGEVTVETE